MCLPRDERGKKGGGGKAFVFISSFNPRKKRRDMPFIYGRGGKGEEKKSVRGHYCYV